MGTPGHMTIITGLEKTLLELEEKGWAALSSDRGADYYREHLTEHALMVFPGIVLTRKEAIHEMGSAPPWSGHKIDDPRVERLTDDSALLTYRGTARREGQPEYSAFMTSVYVGRDGTWKLAFHQHTPLPS
jgi:hypothetical protein